jgi:hypothetical protein
MTVEARAVGEEVQVYFLFDRIGEWPPVPSEGLRAQPTGSGTYRLLETPFFVRNVALDDVVRAAGDGSGTLWAGERVSWSGHQTLRVNPRSTDPTCAQVLAEFGVLGVRGEELEEYSLIALDVQPGVPLQPVKDLLVAGAAQERWWYEEACVGDRWPAGGKPWRGPI